MNCDIDLNIDNYDLDDLLNLFKLNHDFSRDDIRNAKKIVMKTHPDKSRMDKKYFLFFSSAYKIIYSIHEFRDRSDKNRSTEYSIENDEEKEKMIESIKKKSDFNKIFNDLFDKHQIKDEDTKTGYGDWLKSDDDIDTRSTTMSQMNEKFEQKKEEVKALTIRKDVQDTMCQNHFELTGDKPESYSAALFSPLQFEDLKKAHVESVIPVTRQDYDERQKFSNIQDMRQHRNTQDTKPLSLSQASDYLNQRKGLENKTDTQRAFKLAKQDEAARKANDAWMSGFKLLTNT
tara:strand:- start:2627 stop:3493 length:867 start_codon:yes stop_codon:yes gene_type:complete